MSANPTLHVPATKERETARAMKVFGALSDLNRRVGQPTASIAQITALSALAELKGVWLLLEDKGLVTPARVQDYLDRGVEALLKQMEERLNRIVVDVADA